jgi:hypothetical protein
MSGPPVKLDPFKPTAPAIPGVPERAPEAKKQETTTPGAAPASTPATGKGPFAQFSWQALSQSPQMMFGAGVSIVVLIGIAALAWRIFEPAPMPAPVAIEQTVAPGKIDAAPASATAAPQLPDAPGPIATVAEMSKPWSVVKFQFHRNTGESLTGMAIRLPSAPGYWGLLSVAPYGRCELVLDTDLKEIRQTYGYAAIHPMVVDSCTQVVYDPLALGSASGVWIRGKVAAGPGIRPPLEVEIKVEQGWVIADRSE